MQKAVWKCKTDSGGVRKEPCWLHSVHPKLNGGIWEHQAVIALGDPTFPYLELRVVPMRDVLLVRRAPIPIIEEASNNG